ncbi:protein kinase 4-like [Condylostylus longicornis]|uniref:protein kinase 4-like n=1 Tax=Condylostylus longicornis TaxID=2530218 RepID=UPI00244DD747|nr:protein kinase 4-like [Condylostylus longicornis]XP_055376794.1 protein kinase 4-like [Condylostylus longicornis]
MTIKNKTPSTSNETLQKNMDTNSEIDSKSFDTRSPAHSIAATASKINEKIENIATRDNMEEFHQSNSQTISTCSTSTMNGNTLPNSVTKFAIPCSCAYNSTSTPICRNMNKSCKNWSVGGAAIALDDCGSSSPCTSDSLNSKHYHQQQKQQQKNQNNRINSNNDRKNIKSNNCGNSFLNSTYGFSNGNNYRSNHSGFNTPVKGNNSSTNVFSNSRMTTSVTSDSSANANECHKSNDNKNSNGNKSDHNQCSYIKSSLSMTSLPPPDNDLQQNSKETIKAKLHLERPYNSLKKKRNSERDVWRHSWGSGHSQSSCSLHSNATGIIGKDEFWAALQTNYNYIMDTNLLDTCREARCEIEGTAALHINPIDCCGKMLQSQKTEAISEDPRELRKWLRDMENKLSTAPSLLEATQLSIDELQRRLNDHS